MSAWWARGLGLVFAIAGALLWAVNLTSLQPLTEPPVADAVFGNNDFWARDLRWSAVLAVLLGLVLAFRGNPQRSALTVLAIGGLFAVDIELDRADVSGSPAQLRMAVVAAACVLGWSLLGIAVRAWSRPHRAVLVVAAFVAAALAPLAAAATGPDVFDPVQLRTPATLTASLLAAIAIACALAAAPTAGRVARLVAVGFTACFSGVLLVRPSPPAAAAMFPYWMMAGGLMLLTVAALCAGLPDDWRPRVTHLGIAAGAVAAYPFVLFFFIILTWGRFMKLAENLTRLAGNAPEYYADEEHLGALLGVLIGLVMSAAYLSTEPLRRFAAEHPLDPLVGGQRQRRESGLARWMVED